MNEGKLPFRNGTKTFLLHSCASAEQFRTPVAKFSCFRAKRAAYKVEGKKGSEGEELCKRCDEVCS